MRKQKEKNKQKRYAEEGRTYYDDNFSAQEIQLIIITPFNCAKERAAAKLYIFWSIIKEVPFDSKYLRVRQAQFPPSRKQILPDIDKENR